MSWKLRNAIVSGLALTFAVGANASPNAAVFVGGCGSPNYSTIQAAVTGVGAGGVVKVCPGTYPEQVVIDKPLTLEGIMVGTANQSVVASPAGGVVANTTSLATGNPIGAQILVHDTTGVTISNVVVDGAGNDLGACGVTNLVGIYYQDASGVINQVVTRNQVSSNSAGIGCQFGLGIFVQSGKSTLSPHAAGTSTVSVLNSSVHDFQENGITGNEAGTTLTVTGNEVRGQGPTTGAAENGVQLGFGATGRVTTNTVIDEVWAPDTSSDPGDAASGILVYDAADVSILMNRVGNTQFGIAVVGDGSSSAAGAIIVNNTLDGTLIFDGIDVCGSSGGIAYNNKVSGSSRSGIHLDGSCAPVASGGTSVMGNVINEACAGILNGTTGNTTSPNTFYNTGNTILAADECPAVSNTEISRPQIPSRSENVRPHPARP